MSHPILTGLVNSMRMYCSRTAVYTPLPSTNLARTGPGRGTPEA